jgi:ATP-dependent phosphofructokinase / diphosphate-dependent phosphofructokinase
MIKIMGHAGYHRRVAINVGAGFVPGMNSVLMGAALAGGRLGWELVGIRDGFEGLLHPDRYPDGGLVPLSLELVENLDPATGGILGQAPHVDPFQSPTNQAGDELCEVLFKRLEAEGIEAVISAVGNQGLEILYKLHLKGLHTVCIPRSIENDIACTAVSFGFNTALSVTIEMLNKAYQAARSARKIAVVEVPGKQAGWIALQAGIAARADAVLIPEIPCNLKHVAARLKDKMSPRRPYGMVVVAEGAAFAGGSPDRGDSDTTAQQSGRAAEHTARTLQSLIAGEFYPLVVGPWARGGNPTAVDQQLGMAYGGGAVELLKAGQTAVMVAFMPPDIRFLPLKEAVNKVRTVPADSEFLRIAQSLGIYFGTPL